MSDTWPTLPFPDAQTPDEESANTEYLARFAARAAGRALYAARQAEVYAASLDSATRANDAEAIKYNAHQLHYYATSASEATSVAEAFFKIVAARANSAYPQGDDK